MTLTRSEVKNNSSGFITPLKVNLSNVSSVNPIKDFGTMDIETINVNNKQIPIAISMAWSKLADVKAVPNCKLFLINRQIFTKNMDRAVLDLFTRYFDFVSKLPPHTIFVHNLGSFDGYFIMKYLTLKYENNKVSSIIDDSNKFIQISLEVNKDSSNKNKPQFTHWKDSYRIFPVSLNQLSNVFESLGKQSEYNLAFNSISLFNDKNLLAEFKKYAKQDSLTLYLAILNASYDYFKNYQIDLSDVLSTSSLSLKIFRSKFLDTKIPILNSVDDFFIRKSYIGGATDYYKLYGENLYYYDVNSLYPYAMLNPMPLSIQ